MDRQGMTSSRAEFEIVASDQPIRHRRRVSTILIALIAASVVLACFSAVCESFTDHRLMPLFMMRDHLRVYLPPNDGPMLSTLYPPLSVLMYAPAAIFHTPRAAFVVADLT